MGFRRAVREVSPASSKLWRFKYRFEGKEKRLACGKYPAIKLLAARKKRDAARELLVMGIDPSEQRSADKRSDTARAANTFETVARE